jgi:phage terminase small subunit
MDLERKILGRAKIGFESQFNSDVRYRWNNDPDGLTPKMRRFVEEYPKDLNGTQAAIRAGYAADSAAQRGNWLLRQKKVLKALRKEMKRITERNKVNQDNVVRELARIAFSNMADFAEWDQGGVLLRSSQVLSREATAVIKEVSETATPKSTTVKIKLYDKPQSLITLCRYLGILDRETEKDDAKETAKKVRSFLDQVDGSVPGPKQDLPEKVVRFDKRLRSFENRISDARN